jgi:deoxycytidylate deaminase
MKVTAFGVDKDGNIASASNGNHTEKGCTNEVGRCGCTHAETNLLKKMPNPISVTISHSPCINCATALFKAGVTQVIYDEEYRIKNGIDYLKARGVEVFQIKEGTLHER